MRKQFYICVVQEVNLKLKFLNIFNKIIFFVYKNILKEASCHQNPIYFFILLSAKFLTSFLFFFQVSGFKFPNCHGKLYLVISVSYQNFQQNLIKRIIYKYLSNVFQKIPYQVNNLVTIME